MLQPKAATGDPGRLEIYTRRLIAPDCLCRPPMVIDWIATANLHAPARGLGCSNTCGRRGCAFNSESCESIAAFAGPTDFADHMYRTHKYLEIVSCSYYAEAFAKMLALCVHVLNDHQCADCESPGSDPDREALESHLEEEHLSRSCISFVATPQSATHRHVERQLDVRDPNENRTGDVADCRLERNIEGRHTQSAIRTPGLSPPYMRPQTLEPFNADMDIIRPGRNAPHSKHTPSASDASSQESRSSHTSSTVSLPSSKTSEVDGDTRVNSLAGRLFRAISKNSKRGQTQRSDQVALQQALRTPATSAARSSPAVC